MADDFASHLRQTLKHPRCKGLTFWPLPDGRWQVNIAIDNKSNWNVNVDENPLMALWRCMERLKIRA